MKEIQSKTKILVIGNGMVGHHFVEQLVATDPQLSEFSVTVIGAERLPAYDRVHLSSYFAGSNAQDLALATKEQYQSWGVELVLGDPVEQINREQKSVETRSGRQLSYDKLVLATGSYPFVPPITGNNRTGCFVYRTLDDLDAIQAAANTSRVGVVVGGGLLGLEAANALKQLGLETHVVEFAPGLMPVQLDADGSSMLRNKIEALGVQVHTEKATQQITAGDSCKLAMQFADGSTLETDLIVFSAGIRPQDALASQAQLSLGERGGIVVDQHCQTSDPAIYAIGECALFDGRIYGLVAPGYAMARTVVARLLDDERPFTGADMSTKLKLLGVDVGSIGDAHGATAGAQSYSLIDQPAGVFQKLVVSADGKLLLGAVLVGDTSRYDTLLQYHLNNMALPEQPAQLLFPQSSEAQEARFELPDSATVCSCHNVSKGDIVSAVESGCASVGDVSSKTKACTGCGGCKEQVKTLVNTALEAQGVVVNKGLCEHFEFTRQELFHLCQVGEIKSFDALLAKYGQGRGCDICKPAVGSILASLWNEHVLSDRHVGLQDTNDTFLANMQKNGTYSVVPRVPGGEITPDQLLAIGQVAKKYELYTKITGGQRIDLFGARLNHLPAIWQELIDAGLESGHAYAKALRTVKSCVGSTWCRYGVQDSVSMALTVEHRYKGLRAPHKIKMAVSGCTRECAEAQSKDVGVIATENGWNLYVCGNGGMRPRHADLLATDLDDDQLLQAIDRLLMFYIRTADRLQRTSVWLENLDGGIDYLRRVVIEDSLGIGEMLDQQMQGHVASYQCEWQATLQDESKLKRFREFVNAPDELDAQVQFVEERGQLRPAKPQEQIAVRMIESV